MVTIKIPFMHQLVRVLCIQAHSVKQHLLPLVLVHLQPKHPQTAGKFKKPQVWSYIFEQSSVKASIYNIFFYFLFVFILHYM